MTQPTDTNALRSKAENQRENLRYQGHGEPLTGLAIQAADELDRLRAELSEERHAHNKTQFELDEARKEKALIVAWLKRQKAEGQIAVLKSPERSRKQRDYAAGVVVVGSIIAAIEANDHRSKSDD